MYEGVPDRCGDCFSANMLDSCILQASLELARHREETISEEQKQAWRDGLDQATDITAFVRRGQAYENADDFADAMAAEAEDHRDSEDAKISYIQERAQGAFDACEGATSHEIKVRRKPETLAVCSSIGQIEDIQADLDETL